MAHEGHGHGHGHGHAHGPKNILIIVGDYVEDYEIMVPFQILVMTGHNVHVVSPGKKAGDSVKTAVHDFLPGEQTYAEFKGHNFAINYAFDDVKLEHYHGLVIPGGRAPEHLRLNPKVVQYVQHFVDHKKPIAAICHGAQLLAATNAMKGKKCTAYFACQPEVELAGGTYEKVGVDQAVVDGNLVTAVAWPGHPQWMRAFLKLLGSKIEP